NSNKDHGFYHNGFENQVIDGPDPDHTVPNSLQVTAIDPQSDRIVGYYEDTTSALYRGFAYSTANRQYYPIDGPDGSLSAQVLNVYNYQTIGTYVASDFNLH